MTYIWNVHTSWTWKPILKKFAILIFDVGLMYAVFDIHMCDRRVRAWHNGRLGQNTTVGYGFTYQLVAWWACLFLNIGLELRGIDPRTSHMLSERSTTWATAPLKSAQRPLHTSHWTCVTFTSRSGDTTPFTGPSHRMSMCSSHENPPTREWTRYGQNLEIFFTCLRMKKKKVWNYMHISAACL